MNTEKVSDWLQSIGLGHYSGQFSVQGFDGQVSLYCTRTVGDILDIDAEISMSSQSLACANFIAQKSTNSYNAIKDDFQKTFGMSLGEGNVYFCNSLYISSK
jgi:hypothetical protein